MISPSSASKGKIEPSVPSSVAFEVLKQAVPIVVLDHGRAGNYFFMCLFDQHPEVLVIPHVGYFPFHLARLFNKRETIGGNEALNFLMSQTDFKYVAQDLSDDIIREYRRLGNDPDFEVDRPLVRTVLRELLGSSRHLGRADVAAAMHAAYAIGAGRDISSVKYILMNDSPVHYRAHLSSSIEAAYVNHQRDFPRCIVIHLVRDPRAVFASLRHQLLRQANGMYSFTARGLLGALKSVFTGMAGWCVYANILAYTTAGSRELSEWRRRSPNFYLIRNEDINLRFDETMAALCRFLGIGWFAPWTESTYRPTSGGRVWRGVGAYHATYQRLTENKARGGKETLNGKKDEPYRFAIRESLQNDPPDISYSITRPNRYVTERWKSRLTLHEIAFLEAIYLEEMRELGYEPLYVKGKSFSRLLALSRCLYPLSGELFSLSWITHQLRSGLFRGARLGVDMILLSIFFLCSRLAIFRLYLSGHLRTR